MRTIFGSKRNDEGGYEIRSNRELITLFNDLAYSCYSQEQRNLRWTGHVWRSEGLLKCMVTKSRRPDKIRPRGIYRQRWEDRTEENLKLLGVLNEEELSARGET